MPKISALDARSDLSLELTLQVLDLQCPVRWLVVLVVAAPEFDVDRTATLGRIAFR
jgi:hypothetical protein